MTDRPTDRHARTHTTPPTTAAVLSLPLPRLQNKCGPSDRDPPSLRVSLWGLDFPSPVGVAAGFDKHAEAVKGLLGLGLGFVEVGSVTPAPQPGNPKPRMFRLSEDRGVINRYGFNSEGLDKARRRLASYWAEALQRQRQQGKGKAGPEGVVGVNVGKNKLTEKAEDDYVQGERAGGRVGSIVRSCGDRRTGHGTDECWSVGRSVEPIDRR